MSPSSRWSVRLIVAFVVVSVGSFWLPHAVPQASADGGWANDVMDVCDSALGNLDVGATTALVGGGVTAVGLAKLAGTGSAFGGTTAAGSFVESGSPVGSGGLSIGDVGLMVASETPVSQAFAAAPATTVGLAALTAAVSFCGTTNFLRNHPWAAEKVDAFFQWIGLLPSYPDYSGNAIYQNEEVLNNWEMSECSSVTGASGLGAGGGSPLCFGYEMRAPKAESTNERQNRAILPSDLDERPPPREPFSASTKNPKSPIAQRRAEHA